MGQIHPKRAGLWSDNDVRTRLTKCEFPTSTIPRFNGRSLHRLRWRASEFPALRMSDKRLAHSV